MRRPEFIIFTDKDGTLNLEDSRLNTIFILVAKHNGMVIPITGRTVGDIAEELKRQKIKLPRIIIGDNGANVYDTKNKEFIIKKTLEHEKVVKIVEEFLKNGGKIENLRYTDGSNIFASNAEEVKKYYKKSKTVKLYEDILKELKENHEITKITLAGSKKEMQCMADIVSKMNFWTDMDKTKFPSRDRNNYRLDIAHNNINKGEAVNEIATKLNPKYGYICIGNGANDKSMFKVAIEHDMIAAIMDNASNELIEEMEEYSKKLKKGKVVLIPMDKNLSNDKIDNWRKGFVQHKKELERKNKIPTFKESLKVDIDIKNNKIKKIVNKNKNSRDSYREK